MKQIPVPSNWLNDIDGLTVADAIEYLQTLPQDHRLDWYLEGDTHGCYVECRLFYKRPYTEEELAQMAAERKAKRIAYLQRSIDYYESKAAQWEAAGTLLEWVADYRLRAEQQRQKLKELE